MQTSIAEPRCLQNARAAAPFRLCIARSAAPAVTLLRYPQTSALAAPFSSSSFLLSASLLARRMLATAAALIRRRSVGRARWTHDAIGDRDPHQRSVVARSPSAQCSRPCADRLDTEPTSLVHCVCDCELAGGKRSGKAERQDSPVVPGTEKQKRCLRMRAQRPLSLFLLLFHCRVLRCFVKGVTCSTIIHYLIT